MQDNSENYSKCSIFTAFFFRVVVEFTHLEIIAFSVLADFVKNKLDMLYKLF